MSRDTKPIESSDTERQDAAFEVTPEQLMRGIKAGRRLCAEPAYLGTIKLPRDCYYCGHAEVTDENRCERCGNEQPPGEG